MCGIAAIITSDSEVKNKFVEKSITCLRHRGPDQNGSYTDDHIALTHTRLSILDLTEAGRQPMKSSCGRYIIIFNGEIYNHRELRKKWLNRHDFKGHSDTETVVELFSLLKESMLSEMVGMWAIVIYDLSEKKVFITRDRYGQKPLYYRADPEVLRFSSELKPLLNERTKNPANVRMLSEYLAMGNYHHLGEETFFRDINQLLPSTYYWVDVLSKRILTTKKYWQLPAAQSSQKRVFNIKEAVRLKEVIVEAVRSQMLSDVAIGATLSGGLDSSVITGILASFSSNSNPIKIFTAQTINSSYDETHFVNDVAEKWGNRILIYKKNANEIKLRDSLPANIFQQEEPFGDPSIMAHGFLMEMAKEQNVKVVLGGQGADEIARGYRHNIQQLFSHELSRLNFKYLMSEIMTVGYSFSELSRIALGGFLPTIERRLRLRSRRRRMNFLRTVFFSQSINSSGMEHLALANDLESGMRESIYGLHLPHLVHYDDRNAMARSIEGRMPFLDHRVLEAVSEYRPRDFYQNGLSKYLIREACKEFLPTSVYERRDKIGFYTPLSKMLTDDIKWIEQQIMNSTFANNKIVLDDLKIYKNNNFTIESSLRLFRTLSVAIWISLFKINIDG